jgi:hypothetical protein
MALKWQQLNFMLALHIETVSRYKAAAILVPLSAHFSLVKAFPPYVIFVLHLLHEIFS